MKAEGTPGENSSLWWPLWKRPTVARLPSAFMVLRCGGFGNVNGLFERPSQVDGALLDHLSDVLDPVLLVLNA